MKNCQFLILVLELVTLLLVKGGQIYSCTEPNTIALSFDDGPYSYTSELIDLLNKNGIKATFFINAKNYTPHTDVTPERQEAIKKAFKTGHQIASHTYNHKVLDSTATAEAELINMDNFIYKLIGKRIKYMRAPTGECGAGCLSVVKKLGYKIVNWDTDTNDWRNPKSSVKSINYLQSEFAKKKTNYLILMHDPYDVTVKNLVPWIISKKTTLLKSYRFVTVAECLGDTPYSSSSTPPPPPVKEAPAAPEVSASSNASASSVAASSTTSYAVPTANPITNGNTTFVDPNQPIINSNPANLMPGNGTAGVVLDSSANNSYNKNSLTFVTILTFLLLSIIF